jgi:hypothetical protein
MSGYDPFSFSPKANDDRPAAKHSRTTVDAPVVTTSEAPPPVRSAPIHEDSDEELNVAIPRSGQEGGPCGSLSAFFNRIVPKGGMFASSITLASCTLGASITSLPMAFKLCGITIAILLLVAIMLSTVYSIHLLMEVKRRTRLQSYEEMAKYLLGYRMDYVVAINMFAVCFGACVAYIISMGNILKAFTKGETFPFPGDVKIPICAIWFFILLPLSLPKEINTFRKLTQAVLHGETSPTMLSSVYP